MRFLHRPLIGSCVVALLGCAEIRESDGISSESASSGSDTGGASRGGSANTGAESGAATGDSGTSGAGISGSSSDDTFGTSTGSSEASGSSSTATGSDTGSATEGQGSTGAETPEPDGDGDDLPDSDDPFPDDPELPGTVTANVVYAHTANRLYTMEVTAPYAIADIGGFSFPEGGYGPVTDIAIDRWGVLYAITFNSLHVCEPATATCHFLAGIPDTSNGLTFVPPGTLDADDDSLIGIANAGTWRHMQLDAGMVEQIVLGSYGPGYASAGDAFSIEGVGTYASVIVGGQSANVIVEVDPTTGAVLQQVSTLTGYSNVYGLAGWPGVIFAFNSGGEVLLIDASTGAFEPIANTTHIWWGAAVRTVLPQ